jgi:hypothetical protein
MRNSTFLQLVALFRVAGVLLAMGGIASADTFLSVSGLDLNLGGSVWQDASSTAADAYFAGVVYTDVTHSGAAYDRQSLWVEFYTDIYIVGSYGSSVRELPKMDDGSLDQDAWLDSGPPEDRNEEFEPAAVPAASNSGLWAGSRPDSGGNVTFSWPLAIWSIPKNVPE